MTDLGHRGKTFTVHYPIIVLYVLFVHGLLLFMDGVYWDGWIVRGYETNRDWTSMWALFSEAGQPINGYFHWLVGYLPNPILSYHVIAFLSILSSTILTYLLLNKFRLFNRQTSLFIALISSSIPLFLVQFEVVMVPTIFFYALFLLAWSISLNTKAKGIRLILSRVLIWALWFVSFSLPAFLVWYYAFLVLFAYLVYREHARNTKQTLQWFVTGGIDYLVFPIMFWIFMRTVFPPHGLYSDYNQLTLLPSRSSLNGYISYGVDQLLAMGNAIFHYRYVILPMVAVSALAIWLSRKRILIKTQILQSLALGIFLLAAAVIPYAFTGKMPGPYFESRHCLLLGLPIAIIIVSIAKSLCRMQTLAVLALIILLLAFGIMQVSNYIQWQARWVKDASVVTNLSRTDPGNISTFLVVDKYVINSEPYRFYEWSSMFTKAWGSEKYLGVSPPETVPDEKCFNRRYSLAEYNPQGKQAVLEINRGQEERDGKLVLEYFKYRYCNRDKLNDFLSGITKVSIIE